MLSKKNVSISVLTQNEARLVSGGKNFFKKAGEAVGDLNQKVDKLAKKAGEAIENFNPEQEAKNAAESIKDAAKDFKEGVAEARDPAQPEANKEL